MLKIKLTHKELYWVFQLTGWTLFFIFYASVASYFNDYQPHILLGYLNTVLVGFTLTHAFRAIIKWNHWESFGVLKLSGLIILSAIIIGIIWTGIVLPINNRFFPVEGSEELTFGVAIIVVFNLSIVVMGWSLI